MLLNVVVVTLILYCSAFISLYHPLLIRSSHNANQVETPHDEPAPNSSLIQRADPEPVNLEVCGISARQKRMVCNSITRTQTGALEHPFLFSTIYRRRAASRNTRPISSTTLESNIRGVYSRIRTNAQTKTVLSLLHSRRRRRTSRRKDRFFFFFSFEWT